MAGRNRSRYEWASLSDKELLELRFCDLGLKLRDVPVLQERIRRLHENLMRRNLRFRPHCWLAEEWFSPDGIPGIAIPFYLAHPRLRQLEQRQMFEVEGGGDHGCMRLLRHETGHAICTAYQLHRRRRWREVFGNFNKPYPTHYCPRPRSKHFVLHLDWWYAQSHPAEDFAETFAVWLRPRNKWRDHYAGWPVLKKLEYVNELMNSIEDRTPRVRNRSEYESLSGLRKTLGEHYEDKRTHFGIEVPEFYEADLVRLFSDTPGRGKRKPTAAAFLRRVQTEISQICARHTGDHPYTISQLIQEMIIQCRKMRLYLDRPEPQAKLDVAVFVCAQTLNYLHEVRHRIPM
jgi:hypothetical protein